MRVGVPKEIKNQEYRVGLTPAGAFELVNAGHSVVVQSLAGIGIGEPDSAYIAAGASVLDTAEEIFATADMIVKVKEPQAAECAMLRPGQLLFTYLHLAPDPDQTRALLASGASAVAYETITGANGGLPLLAPMSRVAGRLSMQVAANGLERRQGGCGLLLGGVPGVAPAKVTVIGGGVVGSNAIEMALGLRADVTVLDRSDAALQRIDSQFEGRARTIYSSSAALREAVLDADVVIGAVLVPGAAAPKLVTAEHIRGMREGSVVVDVAIDQGGCFETSRATTHDDPTYIVDGVVHNCVANMPGAVPRTSTYALTNATLPYVMRLANKDWRAVVAADPHLLEGLNVHEGKLTQADVASAQNLPFVEPSVALQSSSASASQIA